MRREVFLIKVLLMGALSVVPWRLAAEEDPMAVVVRLNQEAMTDYQNMKIDAAASKLMKAEGMCIERSAIGPELALTYLNMGVIEAAGRQNTPGAQDFFTRAVCLDPVIMMDPLVSTPEVETIFNMARDQALQSPDICAAYTDPNNMPPAGGAIPPPPPGGDFPPPPPGGDFPPPPPPPPPPVGGPPPSQTDNVRHTWFEQQTKLTPLPVYIMVQPGVDEGKVILNYRTYGESIYQQMEMKKKGDGYETTIGCDVMQTFNPTAIEYYIDVVSEGGQIVGSAGQQGHPFQVTMVDTLVGEPPALPDSPPPKKCTEECPPWNPECNSNCKQIGDMCDNSSECCKGMVCEEEACAPGEGEEGGAGGKKPTFRIALAIGTGGGYVPKEEVKPYNMVAKTPFADWIKIPANEAYCIDQAYDAQDWESCYDKLTKGIGVKGGIAWAKIHFRLNPMFYITERLMVGATFRGGFALDTNPNVAKIAPLGLVNFAFRAVGKGSSKYELDLLAGIGGGMILHKITYEDCRAVAWDPTHPWASEGDPASGEDGVVCEDQYTNSATGEVLDNINEYGEWVGKNDGFDIDGTTPEVDRNYVESVYFRKSGFFAIEFGIDQYIWLAKHVGLNIGVIFDVLFLNSFAFNADIQLGVATKF